MLPVVLEINFLPLQGSSPGRRHAGRFSRGRGETGQRRGGGVKVVLPGGSVTFRKARWFTGFHHPDAIVFADGTTWRWKDVAPK